MKTLSKLLEKYTSIQPPHATVKKTFIKTVDKVLDIHIDEQNVKVKGTTVILSVPSVVKNEIRLHQNDILTALAEELGSAETVRSIF